MRSGQEASHGGWWAFSVRTRTSLTLTFAHLADIHNTDIHDRNVTD